MSGGIWSASDAANNSTRPGVYINFLSQAQLGTQPESNGVVMVLGTADWGLVNGVTTITSELEVAEAFGSAGTLGLLVSQALRGGAATVKAYRMAVSASAAEATLSLNDTATPTPAAALTLTAKYEGARANDFEVSVAVNANDAAKKDMTITENGLILETFTFTDNDDLVDQINGNVAGINASRYVTAAVAGADDRTVANLAATAMAGGNSGLSVTATEFAAALASIETEDWDILVPSDTTTSGIQASVRTYVARLRDEGKKVVAVMGGQSTSGMDSATLASALTSAISDAQSTSTGNHEGIVRVFPGIVDEISGAALSGAQSASRVAGMIGAASFNSSITKHPTGATEVTSRLTNAQIKQAMAGGLCVLVAQQGEAVVESGVNTLTTYTDTKSRDFRKIRVVRAIDAVAETITASLDGAVIGYVSNDENGKLYTIGLIQAALDVFRQAGAIEAGYSVVPTPGAVADRDEFFVTIGLTPIDSIEKVFITARVL